MLQCVAVCCSTRAQLQRRTYCIRTYCVRTYCVVLGRSRTDVRIVHCVAVCCTVLCCSMLQYLGAVVKSKVFCIVLQCTATHWNTYTVLQCTAGCFSASQYDVVLGRVHEELRLFHLLSPSFPLFSPFLLHLLKSQFANQFAMGWLQLDNLQKRPMFLRSVLIVATPYWKWIWSSLLCMIIEKVHAENALKSCAINRCAYIYIYRSLLQNIVSCTELTFVYGYW